MNQNAIVPNIGQWKIKEEFNVLSEFDGTSTGQYDLMLSGKKITNYFASEIDKYAIQIANKNFPNTKQLGDVTKIDISKLPKIHLFIGGSPCQGFSFAGKQLNFSDPRSKLFFEFAADLRFIQEFVNPEVKFFLENVKMKKEFQDIISRFLGVEPVFINSDLVSAQGRKRLYWTNIEGYKIPEDKGILLKDIVHEYRNEEFDLNKYLVPFDKTLQLLDKEVQRGKVGFFRTDSQANRVYHIHGKSITLCGDAGGGAAKMGQYLFGCITPDRVEKRQNGQRFNEGEKFYTLTAQDKHGVLIDGYIRKLTPIECERLQNLPDNFTEGVSEAQRYKMLGNGWTSGVPKIFFDAL